METLKKYLRPFYVPIANWHYKTFKAPRRYHHLYDEIKRLKAKSILEVGVYNGRRAIKMLDTAKTQVAVPEYYGFDLFEDLGESGYQAELSKMPLSESEIKTLLEPTGAKINLYRGNTLEVLPKLVPDLPKVDFIFIDGGHSNETIANDWKYTSQLMHENTVVLFDDYWRNRTDGGCKLLIDSLDQSKYEVTVLPEIDRFDNPDFGLVEISFAKVTLKNQDN